MTRLRRARFFIVAAVGVLAVVAVLMVVRGSGEVGGTPFAADGAGPAGSRAVAEVLRSQGVTVRIANTLEQAKQDADASSTLLLADTGSLLDADQLRSIGASAAAVVVVEPGFTALDTLAPGVRSAGVGARDAASADCDLHTARQAGTISALTKTLRADGAEWTRCFPTGDGSYGVLQKTEGERSITLLADGTPLRNDAVTRSGNAALVLGLLGSRPTLVWYLPTLTDVRAGAAPSIADLTPGWVTPVLLLAAAVVVAAAIWRGRRFGPLVIEDLPVTVRASETMEGRARLYARTSARGRAADAVRIGTIGRLAALLGLPRAATVDEVAVASAAITGRSLEQVRGMLLTEQPGTDRALVDLSARLLDLEQTVRRERTPPSTERMDR